MRPTRPGLLLWLALAFVAVGWSLARALDVAGTVPLTPRITPALLAFLAVILLVAARIVRGWVLERRYDRRIDALTVSRLLVVAKAGSVTGAVVAGVYAGVALQAAQSTVAPVLRERVVVAALASLAGVAVAMSALRLERACRVPAGPDDEPGGDPSGEIDA